VAHDYFLDSRRPLHVIFAPHSIYFGSPPLTHVVAPTISHIIGSANLGCSPPPHCHLLCTSDMLTMASASVHQMFPYNGTLYVKHPR